MARFKNAAGVVAAALCFAALGNGQMPAPRIFFTDLESGPDTGGENNNGVYVTIYGGGFGASRGNSTVTVGGGQVASYPVWTDKKVAVQLGSQAQSGNIVVKTAGGTSNGLPFTVRAGAIYFVATNGNDSNNGSSGSPYRTINKCKNSLPVGGTCYVRNGVAQTTVEEYNAAVVVLSDQGGSGTAGSPKALIAYPGESATIGSTSGTLFGIRFTSYRGQVSYWTVAGFNLRAVENGSPIEGVDHIRMIGNNYQCPSGNAANACIESAQSSYLQVLGNEITNAGVANATKLYHSAYFSTDSNHIEVGWNWIHDNNACRAIQFHSSPLDGSTGYNQYDLSVHDNLIHGIRCDGINFATVDPSKGKVEAYNNIIYDTGRGPDPPDGAPEYACIYVPAFTNTGSQGSGTVEIFNNTLVNCGAGGSGGGAITRDSSNANITVRATNNVIVQTNGRGYFGPGSNMGKVNGEKNLYSGNGSGPSATSSSVNQDPKFVDAPGRNYRLQSSSPAKDAGAATRVTADRDGIARPQGSAIDIGAYEYNQFSTQPGSNACDLNYDGSVTKADVDLAKAQALGGAACTADLDGNGSCDVVDVQRVINASLGGACRTGK